MYFTLKRESPDADVQMADGGPPSRRRDSVAAPSRVDGSAPVSAPSRAAGGPSADEASGPRLVYGKIVLAAGADLRGFRAAFEKATAKGIAAAQGLTRAL